MVDYYTGFFYRSYGEPNLRNDNALTASHLANKTI